MPADTVTIVMDRRDADLLVSLLRNLNDKVVAEGGSFMVARHTAAVAVMRELKRLPVLIDRLERAMIGVP